MGATSFTINGLMNDDSTALSSWQIGTNPTTAKITIGANKELVVNAANSQISIVGVIQDNAGGASAYTQTGGSVVLFAGANTYTGTTTINTGAILVVGSGSTGALSPSSAIVNNGTLDFGRSVAMVQGTDFSSSGISGTGGIGLAGTGHHGHAERRQYLHGSDHPRRRHAGDQRVGHARQRLVDHRQRWPTRLGRNDSDHWPPDHSECAGQRKLDPEWQSHWNLLRSHQHDGQRRRHRQSSRQRWRLVLPRAALAR